MRGGIHGGLVYFEPSAREFRRMYDYLCSGRWRAVTDMAEQEFLSHWFGRDGRWYALPPEFNFQLHHVFLSSQWWPPGGQARPSKFYQMLNDTPIIKNWHFSGEKEPVDCLYELVPGESAEVREWRIDMLAHDSMKHEWDRMDASFKANGEHLELILSVHKQATEEWLNCWEGTRKTIFTEALSEIHQHAFTFTHGDSQEIICNACGHTWAAWEDFDDQARDHVLANCPEALKDIEMAITKCPNLMLLPFTPVGKHVEGHLDYLGKVIKSWRRYAWPCEGLPIRVPQYGGAIPVEEAFDRRCDAVVKADIPMYSTPHGLLMVPPPPPPPAGEDAESSDPDREKRKHLRRLNTALDTLRKNLKQKSNEQVADDDILLKTLENVMPAKKSYMHLRDRCPWRPGEQSER